LKGLATLLLQVQTKERN